MTRSSSKIEQLVFSGEIDSIRPTAGKIGRATRIDDALGRYVEFAKASFPRGMYSRKNADRGRCGEWRGLQIHALHFARARRGYHRRAQQPNGTNINADCGSTHPEEIQRLVQESGAHVGITHDGDADRVLLCDENGEIVDGDEILAIAASICYARKASRSTLVATVMSNFGLDETLGAHGGKVIRTKVGDRYVIEEMMRARISISAANKAAT